jgi:hypothetical protein
MAATGATQNAPLERALQYQRPYVYPKQRDK